jgi:arsenate reductase (thioredoxin)
MKKIVTCPIVLIAIVMFSLSVNGQAQDAVKESEQTPVIIFICEHGAAKSIVSAAYFNKLATERSLNFRAIARGTNPDKEISLKVQEGLQKDGLTSSEPVPKKISKADLAGAKRVITFCSLPDGYADNIQVEHWDDLLWESEDYSKSRDRILERLSRLIDELKSK